MKFRFDVNPDGFVRSARNVLNGQFAAINSSLLDAANEIMEDSRDNYCPVDTGALRATGRVEAVEAGGRVVSVELKYGDDIAFYAIPVHEGHRIIAWGHDTGRFQPPTKFLELPMIAHAGPGGETWNKVAGDHFEFAARAWNG